MRTSRLNRPVTRGQCPGGSDRPCLVDLAIIVMRRVSAADSSALIAFLQGDEWPFHAGPRPDFAATSAWVGSFESDSDSVETWWIQAGAEAVGLVRLFDLADDTAMFDLRILTAYRGQGIGAATVRWLADRIFTSRSCSRIEANTRQDNVAMRHALLSCGWAKESHYRASWPDRTGTVIHDAVGYAILRADWLDGTRTPVNWDDEPAVSPASPA